MNSEIESIVLIRHACSTANLDPRVYLTTPDHAIPLARPDTDEQALEAGNVMATLALDPGTICSWSSTYLRCKQTEAIVLRTAFGDDADTIRYRESFLLREQDFGDWDSLNEAEIEAQDPARFAKRKRMTDHLGRFYFRYPNGESRADVVQRIAIFIGKIHRSRYRHHVIFLHGVTQRAFRMAWFNYPVDWFESEPNPQNASVLVIRRDASTGRWAERYYASAREPI
jgi:2,3-bisphosphoglycerate-dependent phosphoglycerate mutase